MSAYRLVQQFEDRTDFPVLLNEVRDAVIRLGMTDRLTFKAVEIEENILRGVCHRYDFRPSVYGEMEERVDILYASSLDQPWQRLVVVKELIHTLDADGHRITTAEEVDDLIRRMARRPELREPMNWGEASDRVALYQALGILFPFAARALIKEKYDAGRISDEMIAHRAVIPDQFVSFLMSSDWDALYPGFMKFCEAPPAPQAQAAPAARAANQA